MKALCLLFHLVMVWPSGTSIPLSSGAIRHPSQMPLKALLRRDGKVGWLKVIEDAHKDGLDLDFPTAGGETVRE